MPHLFLKDMIKLIMLSNWSNYHLLSILPKIYERCMHNEMCKDFDEVPPKSKYGFCKGFPLVMVEKCRRVLGIGRISGVS